MESGAQTIFDQMCVNCIPHFQRHTNQLMEDFTKGFVAKFNKLSIDLEVKHQHELQIMQTKFDTAIADLKREHDELKADILVLKKRLEGNEKDGTLFAERNQELTSNSVKGLTNEGIGNFEQIYIKTEYEEVQAKTVAFECIICKQVFSSATEIQQHLDLFTAQNILAATTSCRKLQANIGLSQNYYCHEIGCAWRSESLSEFKEHIIAHQDAAFKKCCIKANKEQSSGNGRYMCEKPGCGQDYSRKESLSRHVRRHHLVTGAYKCECGKSYNSLHGLNTHKSIHSKQDARRILCQEVGCSRAYISHDALIRHLKLYHLISPYKCLVSSCGQSFLNVRELKAHSEIHVDMISGEELVCRFQNATDLMQHKPTQRNMSASTEVKHNNDQKQKYKCSESGCSRFFLAKHSLTFHVNTTHGDGPPYQCAESDCVKTFGSSMTYKEHLRNHERKSHFLCNQCGKTYKQLNNFRAHLRSHTGERPFICSYTDCCKAFFSLGNLRDHMTVHNENRSFSCKYNGCSKVFRSTQNLRYHTNHQHTGINKFVCYHANCKTTCNSAKTLSRHIKVVHLDIRPYVCPHKSCMKAYPMRYKLNKHLKLHQNE